LIHYLVKAAGSNSNFLLNVGPRPDGTIQPEFIERLHQIGSWLEKNGDSIYGTRGGPIKPMPWGVSTQKGNKIYLHILAPESTDLAISSSGSVEKASLRASGEEIPFEYSDGKLILHIPASAFDEIDTIIELK
jgi:alpha-L-fucosidase